MRYPLKPSEAIKFSRPLRKHQADALDRFAGESEAALFHDPGTGKTCTAIAWLRSHYNIARNVTKTLVITPVAVLYSWENEFKIAAPEKVAGTVLVPYTRTRKTKYTCLERAELIAKTDKKIIVLNTEALDSAEIVQALRGFKPVNLVLDESHRVKNPALYTKNSKKKTLSRFGNLLTISDSCTNRMILTGTPILNSYLDLFAQFRVLDKGITFGTNYFVFRETYFRDENVAWRGKPKYFPSFVPKPNVDKLIAEKIDRLASRVKKSECLDLPPLVEQKHYVELSDEQAKAYYQMETDLLAEVGAGVCAATTALSKVQRLLQILSGHLPMEYDDSEEKVLTYFKTNPRLAAVKELVTELSPKHKCIVWTSFRATYPQVRKVLEECKVEWAELTGETKNRQEQINKFQNDPKCRIMLANAQAGGIGVTLTAASYAIYFSRGYSLGDRIQSEARCYRDGSQVHSKITIIDLVAKDTLDDVVLAALLRKESFSDSVLDRIKSYEKELA